MARAHKTDWLSVVGRGADLVLDGMGEYGEAVEVLPLVVHAQAFPARPSSLPEIRDFVRRRLAQTPFGEEDLRALGECVSDLLLEAAGTGGTIQVSLRTFPGSAEIDVIHAGQLVDVGPTVNQPELEIESAVPARMEPEIKAAVPARTIRPQPSERAPASFPAWLAGALRSEGMTMEAASRRLGVSVKTVSRWISGTTEPRWRDLSRMREIFGALPF